MVVELRSIATTVKIGAVVVYACFRMCTYFTFTSLVPV